MLSHAVPHAPYPCPKSRCPPNLSPPPNFATHMSLQTRTASVEISGCLGHYRIQSSNPQEVQSMLQTVLQTESQLVQQIQHIQVQQMLQFVFSGRVNMLGHFAPPPALRNVP